MNFSVADRSISPSMVLSRRSLTSFDPSVSFYGMLRVGYFLFGSLTKRACLNKELVIMLRSVIEENGREYIIFLHQIRHINIMFPLRVAFLLKRLTVYLLKELLGAEKLIKCVFA